MLAAGAHSLPLGFSCGNPQRTTSKWSASHSLVSGLRYVSQFGASIWATEPAISSASSPELHPATQPNSSANKIFMINLVSPSAFVAKVGHL